MEPLISVLIWLIVFGIVAGLIYWLLTLLPLPEPFRQIVIVAFVIVVVLVALVNLLPLLHVALPR